LDLQKVIHAGVKHINGKLSEEPCDCLTLIDTGNAACDLDRHRPPIALIDFDVLLNENALLAQVALYGGLSTPSGEVR